MQGGKVVGFSVSIVVAIVLSTTSFLLLSIYSLELSFFPKYRRLLPVVLDCWYLCTLNLYADVQGREGGGDDARVIAQTRRFT